MQTPKCKRCDGHASISLAFFLSTIGRKRRGQKMSAGVRLCDACIRAVQDKIGLLTPNAVSDALRGAYTAIQSASGEAGCTSEDAVQR